MTMRRNTIRIETLGSVWYFDDEAGQYLRLPRHDRHTPSEDGPGADQGSDDLVWHDMEGWAIDLRKGRLWIDLPGDHGVVAAPLTPEAMVRAHAEAS